jgi:putative photosynthetic complex assembly protein 2
MIMGTTLDLALAVLFACLVWWASTGLILSLIGQPERNYRWCMLGVSLLAVMAIGAVIMTRRAQSIEGTAVAFVSTIVIWGAVEMAFLMGYVVGPRRDPCPKGVSGWLRFKASWAALAHHELALAALLLLLFVLVQGEPNQLAFRLFALLWLMRLSTKLNIFLGVSNANEDLLPARIAHLKSYFRNAPMNVLFPFSVTAAVVLTMLLALEAIRIDALPHEATAAVLLATFAGLAVLEHWLLVMPLPSTMLWPWAGAMAAQNMPPNVLAPAGAAPKLVQPVIVGDHR